MKSIHLHGKAFDDADFRGLIIGGQNNADTIRFVVPKIYGEEVDLTSWSWAITYENEKGQGDTVLLQAIPSTKDEENLWIDWKPSATATIEKGRLLCQLYAYNSESHKFTTKVFVVYVSEQLDPDPIVSPTPSYLEQALELMAQYNEELGQIRDETEDFKDAAADSAQAASRSATAAKASETAAKSSETKAKESETAAKASETAAKSSETKAKESETAAKTSETKAKESETAAKTSETKAKESETAAKTSETNAKTSETAAKESETNAAESKQQSLEYKQAIEILKVQIADLTQTAENAATAAEEAKAGAEQAMADLDRLIGGIPEDFVETNYRINALEACHLENRDDGIYLIIKEDETL